MSIIRQISNKLLKIVKEIREIFSIVWMRAFIILILLFSLIYFFMPKNSFYHSTVKYEPTTSKLYYNLLVNLENDIKTNYVSRKGTEGIFLDNAKRWLSNIDQLSIDDISFENNENIITFDAGTSDCSKIENIGATSYLHTYFNTFRVKKIARGMDSNGNQYLICQIMNDATSYFYDKETNPSTLDYSLYFDKMDDSNNIKIIVSIDTVKMLDEYEKINYGFSKSNFSDWVRMFYLSTITITTLGFGDIVPLTTAARFAVSFESILGIIILGGFVNSMFKKTKD